MRLVTRRISSKSIFLQYELSREFGVPQDALSAIAIDPALLRNPDATVAEALVYEHLEVVHTHVNDFGSYVVQLAQRHRTSTMGLPGFAMRTAPTLRQGMALMQRYQHLTNTLARFDFIEHAGSLSWSEERFAPITLGQLLATDVAVMVAVQIARELGGEGFNPTDVQIRSDHAPAAYEAFCGCPVRTGAPRGAVIFTNTSLDVPPPGADEDMGHYFRAELQRHTEAREPADDLLTDLRSHLKAQLIQGVPSLDSVSAALGMSGRTLQRKLHESGTTFAQAVETLRRDLAENYLHNPVYTSAEVAFLLGYAEASSFHRAFKRWTGTTPEAFRAKSVAHQSDSAARS